MAYLENLKDIFKTQVLAKGMVVNELLKKDFLDELKSKLGDEYEDIIAADIRLMLIPRLEKPQFKEDKKEVIIQLGTNDFIRFEHPSPSHYHDKIIVITSNRTGILDKVLKK